MKNEYHNSSYDKNIKHFKDSIELLRKENIKLKLENKEIPRMKEIIQKLKKEKLDMSQKIIDYENESLLFNALKGDNEENLLYNQRLSFKKFMTDLKKSNLSFSLKGNNLKDNDLKEINNEENKNDEIELLKNELTKKDEIISLLKSNKKGFKPVIINNFSINSSSNSSRINSNSNSSKKFVIFKNEKRSYLNINSVLSNNIKSKFQNEITSNLSWKGENHSKKKYKKSSINIPNEDSDSKGSLENNIFKEIQSILEEKRNFILKTLTIENFSFDILGLNRNNKNINEDSIYDIKGFEDIDKLIEIIKSRKIRVQRIKKYFEERLN